VSIPAAAKTALVGDLASADPRQLMEIFERDNIAAGIGDAAEWTAGAKALTFTA